MPIQHRLNMPSVPMDQEAERLLRLFAAAATRPSPSPQEWAEFFRFAMHVHCRALQVSPQMLAFRLMGRGFSQAQAERLAAEFDRYCQLLTLYDREKPSR
jgi:hypothetical protein